MIIESNNYYSIRKEKENETQDWIITEYYDDTDKLIKTVKEYDNGKVVTRKQTPG